MSSERKVPVPVVTAEKALEALREWHGGTVMDDAEYARWRRRIDELKEALRDGDRADLQASSYDEDDAFLCACKGEPYTFDEWDAEVKRLREKFVDANRRWELALANRVCMPARFEDGGRRTG